MNETREIIFNSVLSSVPVMTWLFLWPSILPSIHSSIHRPCCERSDKLGLYLCSLFFLLLSPAEVCPSSLSFASASSKKLDLVSFSFGLFLVFFFQRQCIASNGYFLYCSSRSLWTQRCGSTTPCLWASTCSASCWRESPALSVRWSSSLPSSSFATVAGAIAFCTTVTTPRCQMRPTTRS